MLIPGASVDHQTFSLPTVSVNTIDYLTFQDYRCYVPVLRFGISAEAKDGWTVFEAQLDVKAALEHVRAREDNRKVYAIVHYLWVALQQRLHCCRATLKPIGFVALRAVKSLQI